MTPAIKLSGNLGERHRCFNSLVQDAFQQNTLLPPDYPEEPVLDRLLKIDLASKQKNVDYIIHTLKDDDMLYVNRALKSLWLLDSEHVKIINPRFLQQELFPQMLLPAVYKMGHWIQMHLRDPERCEEFYQFYREIDFSIAVKFLFHCPNECILREIKGILDKITPRLLKRLSEKVPQVSKIYYDSLKHNQNILNYYLVNRPKFLNNLRYLLKSDADIFFYIVENFDAEEMDFGHGSLNGHMTKYIMKHHKNRFASKPELYTSRLLNVNSLARYLTSEEIKELVLKLARANFLRYWFSYKKVEPLINHLGNGERAAFIKLVFVDKDYGTPLEHWPYTLPNRPRSMGRKQVKTNLFEDAKIKRNLLQKTTSENFDRHYKYEYCFQSRSPNKMPKWQQNRQRKQIGKASLDQLFDKYRFSDYNHTSNELQKELKAESSSQQRQLMMLVLVSKTGGRIGDLVSFLELLLQYKNEPVNIRASIFRSLVKRAFIWRLPSEHWAKLLAWGHGLGLDGSSPEAACNEGLHAVVIRDLLADKKPSEAVWQKFLDCFTSLKEYSLTGAERTCVSTRLSALLLSDAESNNEEQNWIRLKYLLFTLQSYHIRFDHFPGTVEAVISAVRRNWNDVVTLRNKENYDFFHSYDDNGPEYLFRQLYTAKVARNLLTKECFELIDTDASYVNALRHDISILEPTTKLEKIIKEKRLKHKKFFQKLALYFMEKDGLGERYRAVLEQPAFTAPGEAVAKRRRFDTWCTVQENSKSGRQTLAMPLALLSGSNFLSILNVFDAAPPKTAERQMAAALRANAHLVRPPFDLESFGWHNAGAKVIANRVSICRQRDVERCLNETLSWRPTSRLALVLARRMNKAREIFEMYVSKRPGAALQIALKYFRRSGDNSDPRIWDMVKSNISKATSHQLRSYIGNRNIRDIPNTIRTEYCFLVYLACNQNKPDCSLIIFSQIPALLSDLNERYVYDTNDYFLRNYFTEKETVNNQREFIELYIEIIAKFLVLSTSEEMLEERIKRVGLPLLNQLEVLWKRTSVIDSEPVDFFLDYFLFYLRYNKAYFDSKYVSCLPVFEKVNEWMHKLLPIEKWFDKYVTVHLNIIYVKTVKHCIKRNPELFSDDSEKLEGSKLLGTVFGQFLSSEIEELNQKYFPSVTKVYASGFLNYFKQYISCYFDEGVRKFTVAVLYELINKSKASCTLARYIFCEFRSQLNNYDVTDILSKFNEIDIEELRFDFLYKVE